MLVSQQKAKTSQTYDQTTHPLKPLSIGTTVLIQNTSNNLQHLKKWDKSSTVVEVLPDRQYHVRIDGSSKITLRNRCHLGQIASSIPTLIPTASPNPTNDTRPHQATNNPEVSHNITPDSQQQYEPPTIVNDTTTTQPKPAQTHTTLKRLAPCNKPGLNK